jgi:hypothetical protein
MSTTARTWFATEAEFRQVCGDAQSQAHGESAEEFAGDMVKKANEHGLNTFLSEKQLAFLCKLADIVPPKRVT